MPTRPLLYCAPIAPVVFAVGVAVEGARRPGYSPWRHAVSQLSLGPGSAANVVLILVAAAGLLALALAMPKAVPGPGGIRWTRRLVATAAVAFCLLAFFPIDPSSGYPPGQPTGHSWHGLVHGVVGTVMFATLAAAPLTLRRYARKQAQWPSWRPFDLAAGTLVAVVYPLTVLLTSLDQANVWTNAPSGLSERVALAVGLGWTAVLAGRLLASTSESRIGRLGTAGPA
jgi:Protein of unknown function (DUF998)